MPLARLTFVNQSKGHPALRWPSMPTSNLPAAAERAERSLCSATGGGTEELTDGPFRKSHSDFPRSADLRRRKVDQLVHDTAQPITWPCQCDATERVAQSVRSLAASWLFNPRRQAHFLLECHSADFLMPNVRAEAGPTAKRQARAVENAPARRAGLAF